MTSRQAHLELGTTPQSPGAARRLVLDTLRACNSDVDLQDAALLTSELVTNAVLYAVGPINVRVEASEHDIVVEVEDGRRDALVLRGPRDDRVEGGRGLAIVDAIATSWGVDRAREDGKCVWFALSGRSTPPPALDASTEACAGGVTGRWVGARPPGITPFGSAPGPLRSP